MQRVRNATGPGVFLLLALLMLLVFLWKNHHILSENTTKHPSAEEQDPAVTGSIEFETLR